MARRLVIGLLLAGILLATVGFSVSYAGPQGVGSIGVVGYVLTVLVLAALVLILWISRPFLVKNSTIHLPRSVSLNSGGRTRAIPISQVSDAAIVQTPDNQLEVWVGLDDGTRFRMITFDDDEGREFARRFVDHFSVND